jgi:hypothetical protein
VRVRLLDVLQRCPRIDAILQLVELINFKQPVLDSDFWGNILHVPSGIRTAPLAPLAPLRHLKRSAEAEDSVEYLARLSDFIIPHLQNLDLAGPGDASHWGLSSQLSKCPN